MNRSRTLDVAPALHNMSAPPRSTATVRPLRTDGPDSPLPPRGRGGPATSAAGPSGAFFARLHLVGLLSQGDAHVVTGADIARGGDGLPRDLIDAVAMLRTGRKTGKARAAAAEACARLPVDALLDEFVTRVTALGDRDLPPLLIARPMDPAASVPADCRLDPLTALRLLAGTAGGLFLRARTPSGSLLLAAGHVAFDFHRPASHG